MKGVTVNGSKFDYKAKVKNASTALDDEIKFTFPV